MLLVTSNWCVSDGTLAAAPPRALVGWLRVQVRRAALRSGFGPDGSYRPVEGIDLVFAGDTFDWLVSREWTGDIRPWHAGPRAAAARERVAAGALRRASRLLATLAGWGRRGIAVPVADARGRPRASPSRAVPVRVVLLRGDRDRWLDRLAAHGPGSGAGPVVGRCWSDGASVVHHGEELDPLCAAGDGEPTLGESLAVELLARFGDALDGVAVPRRLVPQLLGRLAAGHPLDTAARLSGWLAASDRAALPESTRQAVIDAWCRCVAGWHRAARRLPLQGAAGIDLVGRIADWLESAGGGGGSDRRRPPVMPATRGIELPPAGAVILGHPAEDGGAAAAWRRQVVCLGGRGLPRGPGVDDDAESPRAVACRPGPRGLRVEWLPLGPSERALGPDALDDRNRGIWFSDRAGDRGGFVDAA